MITPSGRIDPNFDDIANDNVNIMSSGIGLIRAWRDTFSFSSSSVFSICQLAPFSVRNRDVFCKHCTLVGYDVTVTEYQREQQLKSFFLNSAK